MKLSSKSISVVIGTLLIGVVVGALGWSMLHNRRDAQRAEMRRQGGLYSMIDRYIDPIDESQELALRELADAYQDTLIPHLQHYRRHRVELMEAMKEEMLLILSADQIPKMTPWFDRMTTLPESARHDSTRSRGSSRPDSSASN